MYGPYMTILDIKPKYPDEWVFLANLTFKQARLFDDSPQPPIVTRHRERLLGHDESFQVSHQ